MAQATGGAPALLALALGAFVPRALLSLSLSLSRAGRGRAGGEEAPLYPWRGRPRPPPWSAPVPNLNMRRDARAGRSPPPVISLLGSPSSVDGPQLVDIGTRTSDLARRRGAASGREVRRSPRAPAADPARRAEERGVRGVLLDEEHTLASLDRAAHSGPRWRSEHYDTSL